MFRTERTVMHKGYPGHNVFHSRGFKPGQQAWCVWMSNYMINIIPKSLDPAKMHCRRTDWVRALGVNIDLRMMMTAKSTWEFRVIVFQSPHNLTTTTDDDHDGSGLFETSQHLPDIVDPIQVGFFNPRADCLYGWTKDNPTPILRQEYASKWKLGQRTVLHRPDYEQWSHAVPDYPMATTVINRRFRVSNRGRELKSTRINVFRKIRSTWAHHDSKLESNWYGTEQPMSWRDATKVEMPDRKMYLSIIGRLIKPPVPMPVPADYDPVAADGSSKFPLVRLDDMALDEYGEDDDIPTNVYERYRRHGFGPPPYPHREERDLVGADPDTVPPGIHSSNHSAMVIQASESLFKPFKPPRPVVSGVSSAGAPVQPIPGPSKVRYMVGQRTHEPGPDGMPVNPEIIVEELDDDEEESASQAGRKGKGKATEPIVGPDNDDNRNIRLRNDVRELNLDIREIADRTTDGLAGIRHQLDAIEENTGGRMPGDPKPEALEHAVGPAYSSVYVRPIVRIFFTNMKKKEY
ncbi:hypothetical protein QCA50_021152 [Cerrena zonata]|uniref:Uncharacterized protein n=1 Tax=Cerrena zonata TaxID=2478898 RepID=A0AAW0FD22_9APHY